MERVRLGKSDLQVTKLCLGTWNMAGGGGWGPDDDRSAVELIRQVLDAGCNFVDTARGYGNGHSEEVVGEAIAGRRDEVVVATKMLQCAPDEVQGHIEQSLQCMKTDYVDLYICHWPRPNLPFEPFFEELIRAKDAGKIRAIGVSNFDCNQMRRVSQFDVASLQPPLSILWRIPASVMDYCRAEKIGITPYSPLAQGLLTGRYSRSCERNIAGVRSNNVLFSEALFPRALAVASRLDGIADAIGCTSSQAALAWLLQTPGVTSVVTGASRFSQWEDNQKALNVVLGDADHGKLDAEGKAVWDELDDDATMWGWRPQ